MPKGQASESVSDPAAPTPVVRAPHDRAVAAVRLMALVSVALAAMCVCLAFAWSAERDAAACWRTAAEFQYQPEDECRG